MNNEEQKQNLNSNENEQKSNLSSNASEPVAEETPKEEPIEINQQQDGGENTNQNSPKQTNETAKKDEKQNGLSEEEKLLLRTGEGVNLIPKKSKQEVKKEKSKFTFSLSTMISLTLLVVLSLGVVFFNISSKRQLRLAKEDLHDKEIYLQSYTDKYLSNEELLERIDLYREVQKGYFSPREVVEYVTNIVEREGGIRVNGFNLSDDLEFEISGNGLELESVAKLWYLLGIDENIVNINLSSVGKSEEGVRFSFEGILETDKFINN